MYSHKYFDMIRGTVRVCMYVPDHDKRNEIKKLMDGWKEKKTKPFFLISIFFFLSFWYGNRMMTKRTELPVYILFPLLLFGTWSSSVSLKITLIPAISLLPGSRSCLCTWVGKAISQSAGRGHHQIGPSRSSFTPHPYSSSSTPAPHSTPPPL